MIDFKNKLSDSVHFILLLMLAIIIPSGFYNLEGIFIALLFFNWLFVIKGYIAFKEVDWVFFLFFAFFCLFIIGLFYTNNVLGQVKHIERNVSYLLIPILFIGIKLDENMISVIKKGFILSIIGSVLFADIYAIIDYLVSGEKEIFITSSIYNKFTYYGLTRVFKDWHPTYVSLFLNVGLLLAYEVYYKAKKFIKWRAVVIIAITNILLLNSFIGIIAFLSIFYLFIYQLLYKKRIILIGTTILILLLGGLFYKQNPLHYPKIEKLKQTQIRITDKKEERNLINLRLAKWKTSIDVFKKHPYIGTSNGDYKNELYDQYVENGFLYCAEERYSSHNQYLYTLSGHGIIGFIVLTLILGVPFFYNKGNYILKLFLIICSIFFFTEDVLARQQGIVFFIFFYLFLSQPKSFISANE